MRRMMIGCLGGLSRNVIDSFNRANSTTSLGSADTGHPWTNSAIYGNAIGINNNAAYCASSVDAAAIVSPEISNGSVSIVVGTYANYLGFVFRYSDNNNYCILETRNADNKAVCFGKVAGVSFGGASASGYYLSSMPTLANGDVLKITMSGNMITVYVNGVSKGSLTITQNASNTKHGIKINGTTARINSFSFIAA